MVKDDLTPQTATTTDENINKTNETVENISNEDATLPQNKDDNVAMAKQKNEVDKGIAKERAIAEKKLQADRAQAKVASEKAKTERVFFVGKSPLGSVLLEYNDENELPVAKKLLVNGYTKLNPLNLHKVNDAKLIEAVQKSGLFKAIKA